ncbi:hypothetical protein PAPYR_1479 [Paratrimastix pyriformis]|uniref:FYVE-type domain-containing protein n=1 Tax=Paratrimastix pyriformis TaxID=342808 RepID=A0ABQ8URR1_9EUKA|nr:hypothetical protein PAPYR_1479 [Paratrimastix pyriformis]
MSLPTEEESGQLSSEESSSDDGGICGTTSSSAFSTSRSNSGTGLDGFHPFDGLDFLNTEPTEENDIPMTIKRLSKPSFIDVRESHPMIRRVSGPRLHWLAHPTCLCSALRLLSGDPVVPRVLVFLCEFLLEQGVSTPNLFTTKPPQKLGRIVAGPHFCATLAAGCVVGPCGADAVSLGPRYEEVRSLFNQGHFYDCGSPVVAAALLKPLIPVSCYDRCLTIVEKHIRLAEERLFSPHMPGGPERLATIGMGGPDLIESLDAGPPSTTAGQGPTGGPASGALVSLGAGDHEEISVFHRAMERLRARSALSEEDNRPLREVIYRCAFSTRSLLADMDLLFFSLPKINRDAIEYLGVCLSKMALNWAVNGATLDRIARIFAPYLIRPNFWGASASRRSLFLQSRFVYLFLLFIKKKHLIFTPDERAEMDLSETAFLDSVIREVLPPAVCLVQPELLPSFTQRPLGGGAEGLSNPPVAAQPPAPLDPSAPTLPVRPRHPTCRHPRSIFPASPAPRGAPAHFPSHNDRCYDGDVVVGTARRDVDSSAGAARQPAARLPDGRPWRPPPAPLTVLPPSRAMPARRPRPPIRGGGTSPSPSPSRPGSPPGTPASSRFMADPQGLTPISGIRSPRAPAGLPSPSMVLAAGLPALAAPSPQPMAPPASPAFTTTDAPPAPGGYAATPTATPLALRGAFSPMGADEPTPASLVVRPVGADSPSRQDSPTATPPPPPPRVPALRLPPPRPAAPADPEMVPQAPSPSPLGSCPPPTATTGPRVPPPPPSVAPPPPLTARGPLTARVGSNLEGYAAGAAPVRPVFMTDEDLRLNEVARDFLQLSSHMNAWLQEPMYRVHGEFFRLASPSVVAARPGADLPDAPPAEEADGGQPEAPGRGLLHLLDQMAARQRRGDGATPGAAERKQPRTHRHHPHRHGPRGPKGRIDEGRPDLPRSPGTPGGPADADRGAEDQPQPLARPRRLVANVLSAMTYPGTLDHVSIDALHVKVLDASLPQQLPRKTTYLFDEHPELLNHHQQPLHHGDSCELCSARFTLFHRGMHCNYCSRLLCRDCCRSEFLIPWRILEKSGCRGLIACLLARGRLRWAAVQGDFASYPVCSKCEDHLNRHIHAPVLLLTRMSGPAIQAIGLHRWTELLRARAEVMCALHMHLLAPARGGLRPGCPSRHFLLSLLPPRHVALLLPVPRISMTDLLQLRMSTAYTDPLLRVAGLLKRHVRGCPHCALDALCFCGAADQCLVVTADPHAALGPATALVSPLFRMPRDPAEGLVVCSGCRKPCHRDCLVARRTLCKRCFARRSSHGPLQPELY